MRYKVFYQESESDEPTELPGYLCKIYTVFGNIDWEVDDDLLPEIKKIHRKGQLHKTFAIKVNSKDEPIGSKHYWRGSLN